MTTRFRKLGEQKNKLDDTTQQQLDKYRMWKIIKDKSPT